MLELTFRRRPTVRFAFSPLWESVARLRSLCAADVERTADAIAAATSVSRTEFEVFADLAHGGGEYIPTFLAPSPVTAEPRHIHEELHRLAALSDDAVRGDLMDAIALRSGPTGHLRALMDEPARVRDIVIRSHEAYWKHALEAEWSRCRDVLEADVLFHARRLAFGGDFEAVVDGLGPRLAGKERTVLIRCDSMEFACESEADDIVLVPSVSTWPETFIEPGSADASAAIYYPARGTGRASGAPAPAADDRLARLLGRTRAAILSELGDPVTTTGLARRFELSASAVSQHLSRLHEAGLTRRARIGRRVYYERSRRGEELVTLFHD